MTRGQQAKFQFEARQFCSAPPEASLLPSATSVCSPHVSESVFGRPAHSLPSSLRARSLIAAFLSRIFCVLWNIGVPFVVHCSSVYAPRLQVVAPLQSTKCGGWALGSCRRGACGNGLREFSGKQTQGRPNTLEHAHRKRLRAALVALQGPPAWAAKIRAPARYRRLARWGRASDR